MSAPVLKRNYQKEMEAEIASLGGRRPTLLLHSCCGPCSSAVLERLREHFCLTVLYYNPNIEPEEEYDHRLAEQKRLLSILGEIPLLPCAYDHDAFTAVAAPLASCPEGGARCLACFGLRMNETARQARLHGFEYFTTTLSVSPHKNAEAVNRAGEAAAEKYGVKYLTADFKKKNGYLRSLELSRVFDLYRQDYCGCLYGKNVIK